MRKCLNYTFLYVQFSSKSCDNSELMVGFGHQKHSVRVRKLSCFGMKYPVRSPQTQLQMFRLLLKDIIFCCHEHSSEIDPGSQVVSCLQMLKCRNSSAYFQRVSQLEMWKHSLALRSLAWCSSHLTPPPSTLHLPTWSVNVTWQVVQKNGTQPVPCTKVNISVICSILSMTRLMLNLKLQPAADELSLANANSVVTT